MTAHAIAEAVRLGLSATPKALPAYLLYDAQGSALFERITEQYEKLRKRNKDNFQTRMASLGIGKAAMYTTYDADHTGALFEADIAAVPLDEDGEPAVDVEKPAAKKRAAPHCNSCGQLGHTRATCEYSLE